MVKSGEVFQVPETNIAYPYCNDSSRPRNIMMPQGIGFAIRAAVQESLWPIIEQAFPEFCHGMTSETLADKISQLGDELTCIDGSAFEGSQFSDLRDAVEGPFWNHPTIQAALLRIFEHPDNKFRSYTPAEAVREFTKQSLNFLFRIFLPFPGTNNHLSWQK